MERGLIRVVYLRLVSRRG